MAFAHVRSNKIKQTKTWRRTPSTPVSLSQSETRRYELEEKFYVIAGFACKKTSCFTVVLACFISFYRRCASALNISTRILMQLKQTHELGSVCRCEDCCWRYRDGRLSSGLNNNTIKYLITY